MARGINLLKKEVQPYANRLVEECARQGLSILITDTLRTKQEQDALYAKGRTEPGEIITKARYPQSNHCWGIAFDICRNESGKGAYDDSDGFFAKVGKIGKSIGLDWGGDWTSFKDKPHFEYGGFGKWRELQAKYGTPSGFIGGIVISQEGKGRSSSKGNNIIREFQNELNAQFGKGLVADGIWGTRTEEASVVIKRGARGNLTRILQKALSEKGYAVASDGVFGADTEEAVKRLQRDKGLAVDGIVGKNTWEALFK